MVGLAIYLACPLYACPSKQYEEISGYLGLMLWLYGALFAYLTLGVLIDVATSAPWYVRCKSVLGFLYAFARAAQVQDPHLLFHHSRI